MDVMSSVKELNYFSNLNVVSHNLHDLNLSE